jgi:hypothetical protein
MKIFKIKFLKEKPYTQKEGNQILTPVYSEPDEGWWVVYASSLLSKQEALNIIENKELFDKYFQE